MHNMRQRTVSIGLARATIVNRVQPLLQVLHRHRRVAPQINGVVSQPAVRIQGYGWRA
jgi:hypothetical protein